MNDLRELTELIGNAENIVFFGGAGVSTESGIPDFRGEEGLFKSGNGERKELSPEAILHINFFERYPEEFYEYYKTHMIYPDASPNRAHYALARLEEMGKLSAVITQNIDGLHQMAGSKNVFELHGSVHRNHCMGCGKSYGLSKIIDTDGVPRCDICGEIIKPDVVLYGEPLENRTFIKADEAISECDVLIVGGTSLQVYPASSLVPDYCGDHLVLINKSATPYDYFADIILRDKIGEVLEEIVENL